MSDPSGTLATPLPVVEQPGTRKGLGRVAALVSAGLSILFPPLAVIALRSPRP